MEGKRAIAGLLKLAMLVLALWWLFLWWLFPTDEWSKVIEPMYPRMTNDAFGETTYYMVHFTGVVLVFTVLAALYLQVTSPKTIKRIGNNSWLDRILARGRPRVSLWSYPVLTRGYLGVVTAAELLFIVFLVALTVWTFGYWTDLGFKKYLQESIEENKWTVVEAKVWYAGLVAGFGIIVPMAFVFLPVSRGSVLLRLVNIPFEHAVKYHKWSAFIMLFFTILHGVLIVAWWQMTGKLAHDWKLWQSTGINNLAGVLAGVVGVLILVTSLHQVRNRFFELFFGVHQLYVAWVLLAMIHLGEWSGFMFMGGVFIFMLDRVLRFIQSRKQAGIISVRSLPGDTTELVFAKHPSLQYTAAAFLFVQIPALSWWQWHPFTMASSSLVEKDRVTILVKRVGAWTTGLDKLAHQAQGLAHNLDDSSPTKCPFAIKAAVEGPYGHQHPYFLGYQTLILVAGGSGIAPFISILKDLIHRHNNQNSTHDHKKSELPSDVTLVWAVRKDDELQILNCMTFPEVPPSGRLKLRIQGYVTRQQVADPEDVKQGSDAVGAYNSDDATMHPICPELAKDSNWGHILVLTAAIVGLLLAWALFIYFITGQTYDEYNAWIRALWFMLAAALGAGLFGGGAALTWTRWVQPQVYRPPTDKSMGFVPETEMKAPSKPTPSLLEPANTHYGSRPNVHAFFSDVEQRLAGQNAHVGVLVCGPEGMQQSVAVQCQAHSSLFGSAVAFHYHSVSFDF